MNAKRTYAKALRQLFLKSCTAEAALSLLALAMIAVFHGTATQDRLLLNLYYLGIVGTAYVLVRRRAFALAVLVALVAIGTTLAQVYFSGKPEIGDPLLGPVYDFAFWALLLFVGWRFAIEAYRLQTEEHRLQLQREIDERALAMRVAALTTTSHEVRQPLSAILALAETLLDASVGPLSEMQRDFVTDIDESAKYLLALVNDILDCAKAEAGMIELVHETVALPELVDQCIAIIEPKAAQAGLVVTAQISPDLREIVADPLRLKQILLNLLVNAVKFTEKNGSVKMQVRSTDKDVLISVRDTGRGIEPEQIEHLFDPYYQAASGDSGIGTGLGLSIVRHLTQLHGGSISVESVPGVGSVFCVSLPRAGTSSQHTAAQSAATAWNEITGTRPFEQTADAACV